MLVAEDERGARPAGRVEARAGGGGAEREEQDEQGDDHERAPAGEHRRKQDDGHGRLEAEGGERRDGRMGDRAADRVEGAGGERGGGEPGTRRRAERLGGDVARGVAAAQPAPRPEAERDGGVQMGARAPAERRQRDGGHDRRDERTEREEARSAGVAGRRGGEEDRGHEHGGAGRLGAPAAPAGGGVLAHGYIAMSGAGSASGCLRGAPPCRSSTSPVSGKSRTESSPAPISAALPAASMRCRLWPIAVAATMKGSEVACMIPAIAAWRPSSTRR